MKTAFHFGRRRRIVVPQLTRALRRNRGGIVRGRRGVGVTLLGGIASGATLMYFFDPDRGTRRRAVARNKLVHLRSRQQQFIERGVRDARQRGAGVLARLRMQGAGVDDDVLVARVRAELGRHVSHASAIEVHTNAGEVTLRGPILHDEVRRLMRAMRRVNGVRCVHQELEMHDADDRVPGLQGKGHVPRPLHRREHLPPAHRLVSTGAGLMGMLYGMLRGGLLGGAVTAGSIALVLRATMNRPLRKLFGVGDEARVTIQKTVTVEAPIEDVYGLWSRFENFPNFMEHIEHVEVEQDGRISHWRVLGPAHTPIEWDAELLRDEPGECLSWRTTSGTIMHTGEVRFDVIDANTTRVHVRMHYTPPAGLVGHSLASLFGQDPKHAIDRDLVRMKSLLEDGKTTLRGRTIGHRDLGQERQFTAGSEFSEGGDFAGSSEFEGDHR